MTTSIPNLATAGVLLMLAASSVLATTPEKKGSSLISAAPAFSGGAAEGRTVTLSSLKGKPVLLLIAPSPKDRAFRRQISELSGRYERLAADGIICFAAFTSDGGVIPSNVPFLTVNNPAVVASSYDVTGRFSVAVIGRDGNLDCLSTKPLPGQRILDLINNNASVQEHLRR
jgi:hypothetical protein